MKIRVFRNRNIVTVITARSFFLRGKRSWSETSKTRSYLDSLPFLLRSQLLPNSVIRQISFINVLPLF